MNAQRFEHLREIFTQAQRFKGAAREEYLRQRCADDGALLTELRDLLRHDDAEHAIIDRPVVSPLAASVRKTPTPVPAPGAPERFPGYEKVQRVSSAMGLSLYDAVEAQGERRKVRLWVVPRDLCRDARSSQAISESARVAARLIERRAEPGLVGIHNVAVSGDGRVFLACEREGGEEIECYCDRNRLSLRQRLGLFIEVCRIVEEAHAAGIPHLGLDASCVRVLAGSGENDLARVRICGFGLAEARRSHRSADDPRPTGAELFAGTRTDTQDLGALLYRVLVGVPATPSVVSDARISDLAASTQLSAIGDRAVEVATNRHATRSQLLREVAGELRLLLAKAPRPPGDAGYASVQALREDIERFLNGEALAAGTRRSYRLRKGASRHLALVVAGGLVALTLLGVLIVLGVELARTKGELQGLRGAGVKMPAP